MDITTIELTDPEVRYLKMVLFSRAEKYHDQQNHAVSHGGEFFDSLEDLVMNIIDKLEGAK